MAQILTGGGRWVGVLNGGPGGKKQEPNGTGSDVATDDPVSVAKSNTEAAMAQQSQAEQEAESAEAKAQAKQATDEAAGRSDKAYATKPGTPSSKKAHETAQLAHSDAKAAWMKQAGAGSGNDLDARTKAKRQADSHGSQAERHGAMCKGGLAGSSTYNSGETMQQSTGSKNVVANVVNGGPGSGPHAGGGKNISPMGEDAEKAKTTDDHSQAAGYHKRRGDALLKSGLGDSADAHYAASDAHNDARKGEASSKHAQEASKAAHISEWPENGGH